MLVAINDVLVDGKPKDDVIKAIRRSPRPLTLTFFRAGSAPAPQVRSKDAQLYNGSSALEAVAARPIVWMRDAETGQQPSAQGGTAKAAVDPPRPQYDMVPFQSILSQPRCLSIFVAFLMLDGSHHDLMLWMRLRDFIHDTTSAFESLEDLEEVQNDCLGGIQDIFRLHFDSDAPMKARNVSRDDFEDLANSCSMLQSMLLESVVPIGGDSNAALAMKLARQEQAGTLLDSLTKIQVDILSSLRQPNGPYYKFYTSTFYRYIALTPESQHGSTGGGSSDTIQRRKSMSDENTLFEFFNLNDLRRGLSVHRAPKQEPIWLLGSGKKCGVGDAFSFGLQQKDAILSCSGGPSVLALGERKDVAVANVVPVHGIVELSAVLIGQKWCPEITKVVQPPPLSEGKDGASRQNGGVWNPPKQMPDFFVPNGAENTASSTSPPPPMTSAFVINQSEGNLYIVHHTAFLPSSQFNLGQRKTDQGENDDDTTSTPGTGVTVNTDTRSTTSAVTQPTSKPVADLHLPRGLGIVCREPLFRQMRSRLKDHFRSMGNWSIENMQPENLAALLQPFSFTGDDDANSPVPAGSTTVATVDSPSRVDLPHLDISLEILFRSLDVPTIVKLFSLCLLEAKVLLVSSRYTVLTAVAEAVKALLFPLAWAHVYVPVLPRIMLDSLQCPAPFLIGIHSSYAFKRDFPYVLDLVVVNLDRGTIAFQSQGDDPLTTKWPSLPRQMSQILEEDLNRALTRIVQDADDLLHDSTEMQAKYQFPEANIRECFYTFVQALLQDCALCSIVLSNADDRKVLVFDEDVHLLLFGTEHAMPTTRTNTQGSEQGMKDFLQAFFSTQAFSIFLSTKFL
jgi:hypothetical protein